MYAPGVEMIGQQEASIEPILDPDQFYVAYLTAIAIQTLYRALDCYEDNMEPLARDVAEELAIVTDALDEAMKQGLK